MRRNSQTRTNVIFVVSRDWFGSYEPMRSVISISKQLALAVDSRQHGEKQGKGALAHLVLTYLSLELSNARRAALAVGLQLCPR